VAFNVVSRGEGRFHRATSGDIVLEQDEAGTAHALSVPGLKLRPSPDIAGVQWGKLLVNLNNALNALSDLPLRQQLAQRAWRRLFADQMAEGRRHHEGRNERQGPQHGGHLVGVGGGRLLRGRGYGRAGRPADAVRSRPQHPASSAGQRDRPYAHRRDASEASYDVLVSADSAAAASVREDLLEKLEAANYPVRDTKVVHRPGDIAEIVATLVSQSIEPDELDAVVAGLAGRPGVRHATWNIRTLE
jgi:hypothetical protein